MIHKLSEDIITNQVGKLFREYNIVEYKSPTDTCTIDDFYKTLGYACIYKGLSPSVNSIKADNITVSIFLNQYPRELMRILKTSEHTTIEEVYPGIFYVNGDYVFPVQIVVFSRLEPKEHAVFRILSNHASIKDIETFLANAQVWRTPGDRNNIDAVLEVSATANTREYDEVRRVSIMCNALRELMKEEIEEEINNAVNDAVNDATEKGLRNSVKASISTALKFIDSEDAAIEAISDQFPNMTLEELKAIWEQNK